MMVFEFFKRLRKGTEGSAAPAPEPAPEPAPVAPPASAPVRVPFAPEDIRLFDHSVQGYSDNRPVHLGVSAHFHVADQTVYIQNWGPTGTTVEQYAIPEHVGKTRDEINQYLSEVEHVFIPGNPF